MDIAFLSYHGINLLSAALLCLFKMSTPTVCFMYGVRFYFAENREWGIEDAFAYFVGV